LFLVKNTLMKRKCETVCCHDAIARSFVAKVLSKVCIFSCSCHDCLACQDKFFVKTPLDIKENYEHALYFAFHLSRLFSLDQSGLFHSNAHVWLTLSSLIICLT
jgi:hypothetical protein